MDKPIKEFQDNGMKVQEFPNGAIIKTPITQVELTVETIEHQITVSEIAEETLLESKYQTLLLEMML